MNGLYFACCDCKIYTDAGYRWAYWGLEEPRVVSRGARVDPNAVLAAVRYWNPPNDETSRWLREGVLPGVRQFMIDHGTHQIVFGQEEDFAPGNDDYLDWMQIGHLAQLTPRYLVEVLGLRSWDEVQKYMERQEAPPAWWEIRNSQPPWPYEKARRRFEELVGKSGPKPPS